jgi:hypothetical protein
MCPHTPLYVPSYSSVCLYMCPHTPLYVPSYCRICVLILLYMCPHTAVCALILLLQTCLPESGQTSRMPYVLSRMPYVLSRMPYVLRSYVLSPHRIMSLNFQREGNVGGARRAAVVVVASRVS